MEFSEKNMETKVSVGIVLKVSIEDGFTKAYKEISEAYTVCKE